MSDTMKKDLTLGGEVFTELRKSFESVLQRLIKTMEDTSTDEGSITVKLDVSLKEEFVPDYVDGKQNGGRDILKPKFEHKVTSAITMKDESKGSNDTEMELAWDEETKSYVLKAVSGQQMTMDEYLQRQAEAKAQQEAKNEPIGIEANTPMIEGPAEALVKGMSDAVDAIDAEFREVEDDPETDGVFDDSDADGEDDPDGSDDGEEDFNYDEPEEQ